MTITNLKETLLATGSFIDNKYLDKYIQLVSKVSNMSESGYSEKHHVIPVSYYKALYEVSTRAEAKKLADSDSSNYLVQLSYKNHCLAHCLLYFCTIDKLKQDSAVTVMFLAKQLNIHIDMCTCTYEDILEYIDQIKNDESTNYFTSEEDQFLIENYYTLGNVVCAKHLNRPLGSVSTRAQYLGVVSKSIYTDEQKEFIIKYYPQFGAKYCAEHLGRSVYAIQKYAEAALHVKKPKGKQIYCVELNRKFVSAAEAAKCLNLKRTSICNALKKYAKTAGGYQWKYVQDMEVCDEERKNSN